MEERNVVKFKKEEFAVREYIKKLETFHDEEYVSNLAEKTMILIKNPVLRKKMGEAGYKEISQGKFSIEKKNKQLERIYREAVDE